MKFRKIIPRQPSSMLHSRHYCASQLIIAVLVAITFAAFFTVVAEAFEFKISFTKDKPYKEIVEAFGDVPSALKSSQDVTMAIASEYGDQTISNSTLKANTTYTLQMTLPDQTWNTTGHDIKIENFLYRNRFSVEFYYPKRLLPGQTGRLLVKVIINRTSSGGGPGSGTELYGVLDFATNDVLALSHGNELGGKYVHSGGDVTFENGTLNLRFYTSYTRNRSSEFCGEDYVYCQGRYYED